MNPRVTIAQVAAHAGVSAMTVSNVVNARAGANDATRQRVLRSVAELGYVPNVSARGLKSGRTGLVGVVMLDLTSQYALEITRGIADELASAELEILISATYQDASREEQRIALLSQGLVDGIILIAPVLTQETRKLLSDLGRPVVVIDPRQLRCSFPHVIVNNYQAMRDLTDLVVAAGHSRILYLAGDGDFDSTAIRREGFTDAVKLAGLRSDDIEYLDCTFSYESGFRATKAHLEEHQPTAIVASSDTIAFGAIDAARAHGLQLPEDLSIVGFDDLPQAANSFPGLTTVRQPLHDMGGVAVRTLLSQLDGIRLVQQRIELRTTVIERASLAAPRRSDLRR